MRVNLDPRIVLLIREANCLTKMDIPVPVVTHTLLCKKNYFTLFLLNELLTTVRRVKLEVRPLFLPQLVRLTNMLTPALTGLNWTDPGWRNFVRNTTEAIRSFDVLVTRVHDVYTNRILQVLSSMQTITLHALPTEEPWTVDEFIENTEGACRHAAIELNRKSQMVEEAVEEVLELVRKAAEVFKATHENDDFDFIVDDEPDSPGGNSTPSSQQGQDWSSVWECFENPQMLLAGGGGLSRSMQDLVRNAVSEMRRYYSRKVVDVLIKVTRTSLDTLRKRFNLAVTNMPVFLLNALLMIPNIVIRPSLEDVQEALVIAGRNITGVAKGVAQWTGGKQIKLTTRKKLAHKTFKLTSKASGNEHFSRLRHQSKV
ncbi:hypothetical protein J6590_049807 [Homalodisca vitripennis]|nr:hypothetical protein J6590_049807 [Homalodisca vitripennis]